MTIQQPSLAIANAFIARRPLNVLAWMVNGSTNYKEYFTDLNLHAFRVKNLFAKILELNLEGEKKHEAFFL